ncbi:MAG: thioredoxin domain-containing protein [Candidatus Gracilibacteria bacterium]
MKKLFALILAISYLFSLNVNAYSIMNVSNNVTKYEKQFKQKINLTKINNIKLNKLNKQIETLINNTEKDEKKSDNYKEVLLGKLIALKNIINSELTNRELKSSLVITIIDDKRCTTCMTKDIVEQLKVVPFLVGVEYVQKDFSDTGVSDYLKENNITKLPVIILSTNKINDEGQMTPYLKELKDNQYYLEIGANYDPFIIRSDKGFLVLDKEILNQIKANTYLKGNKDAEISWIEYSDLECPYCAKLHNGDVPTKIESTYGNKVNKYFNSFPLEFHKNAMPAARIIECFAEQKGADAFYSLLEIAYKDENSYKDYLIGEAINLGADKDSLEKCVNDGKYDKRILEQQLFGTSTFGISGTPASILINNETGEYEVISGAYPFEAFQKVIDSLLK